MNVLKRIKQLFAATLALALAAQGASAQTLGSTVASFNILANPQVVLTGFSPTQPLNIPVVGTSPGITLTLTNASAGTYHPNDTTSINGMSEGLTLYNSLTNPPGATFVVFGAGLPAGALIPAPSAGITVYQVAAALSTTNGAPTIITGGVNDVVIFQVGTALTNTDHDVQLVGIQAKNVYWQVTQAASVTNDDATPRGFPGTIINNTIGQDITVVSSGAGALRTGRLVSLGGKVSVTQSGAGVMTFDFPFANGGPTGSNCTAGNFYPSPATGRVGTFSYCMELAGNVKIQVWNVIGDLASKIEDVKPAGSQTSTMDTARLAPGIYLYVLERSYVNGQTTRSNVKKFVVKH